MGCSGWLWVGPVCAWRTNGALSRFTLWKTTKNTIVESPCEQWVTDQLISVVDHLVWCFSPREIWMISGTWVISGTWFSVPVSGAHLYMSCVLFQMKVSSLVGNHQFLAWRMILFESVWYIDETYIPNSWFIVWAWGCSLISKSSFLAEPIFKPPRVSSNESFHKWV